MREMKYCCHGIHGGCYFEFQKGDHEQKQLHWLDSSLFLHADTVDELGLGLFFYRAIPGFNYYGPTKISRRQWETIKSKSAEASLDLQNVINEIDMWAQVCLGSEDCFSILGI